jgi:hypothetical protein
MSIFWIIELSPTVSVAAAYLTAEWLPRQCAARK